MLQQRPPIFLWVLLNLHYQYRCRISLSWITMSKKKTHKRSCLSWEFHLFIAPSINGNRMLIIGNLYLLLSILVRFAAIDWTSLYRNYQILKGWEGKLKLIEISHLNLGVGRWHQYNFCGNFVVNFMDCLRIWNLFC